MDKWLDAYGTWPANYQMTFSIIFMILGLIWFFLLGLWLLQMSGHASVWFRGWPTQRVESAAKPPLNCPIPGILDWRAERMKVQEEMEYQAKLQRETETGQLAMTPEKPPEKVA